MGILGLSKLIADIAPEAIKENEYKNYFGKYFFKAKLNVFAVNVMEDGIDLNFLFVG